MGAAATLEVSNLRVELTTRDGISPVIDDLSFSLRAGETLALVGESGCGKSMTALAVMGLLPHPVGRIAGGSIFFDGEDLVAASDRRLRDIRGNDISMIFQEPMTSLNPVYTVGEQIAEVLRRHQGLGRRAAWEHAIELLNAVGIPDPAARVDSYPHQMSGGQRQRVMIAIALACKPKILIADEPTTALDVTVQAQIFDLLRNLQRETGTTILLITHDMGAVCELAERMMVMYAGRKVEEGGVDAVIAAPRHPYTKGLIDCVPHMIDNPTAARPPLVEIPGIVPPLRDFGAGRCLFAARCAERVARCAEARPEDVDFGAGHRAACWQAGAA
ncbi:MAG: ABC transporter ATP-binding protein [Pseudomonadota bacterium]|nr:ABC transporter ATP-binding protein [Alphaproteobacteria bacterium]MEC7122320.1 ABC transporter ATP-binding protein [Pseudomonadota bacterium]MEC7516420.1 ABC transporter ATP-binding protein [Pseudomonadota bacterium]MEC7592285.1 ABC transporter ATP-binding protein [Pseudomonadota bacterium]MEC8026148.1 ABC transporter ATP-binding protein [Pseudomonadota bacterium]